MYHELFDLASEIRALEREQVKIKNALYQKKRKWIISAKHITGRDCVVPPWSERKPPDNIIHMDGEHGTKHDSTGNCQGNNGIGSELLRGRDGLVC